MNTITVVFFSNDRFAMLLGISLASLFENKKSAQPIDVYVIDSGISADNKERLGVLEKQYRFTIRYVHFDKPLTEEIPLTELGKGYPLPIENYHRLCIARFLPASCERVIVMDADTVVLGDVSELFKADLGGKTIGAVAECYPSRGAKQEYLEKLCKSFGQTLRPGEFYLNSGILLVDLRLWRERKVEEKVLALIRENPDKLRYHDQDALNILLLGDRKELPSRYNLLTAQPDILDHKNPFIVHFAGGDKPWYFFSALPYHSQYIYYANKTPWRYRKYRKLMDIHFAKKYHIYSVAWGVWNAYKTLRQRFSARR